MNTNKATMVEQLQNREAARVAQFDVMTLAVAKGEHVDAEAVEGMLKESGRTLNDFSAEVARRTKRIAARARYDSGIKTAIHELRGTATPPQRAALEAANQRLVHVAEHRKNLQAELLELRESDASDKHSRWKRMQLEKDIAAAQAAEVEALAEVERTFAIMLNP